MIVSILWCMQIVLFFSSWVIPRRNLPASQTGGRTPRSVCMLLSFSLAVAAFVIWQGGAKDAPYVQWVFCGMLASFIGDLIMAKVIPLSNYLVGGMAAFGAAHALYLTAYAQTLLAYRADWINPGLGLGIGFYLVVTVLGWLALIRNPEKPFAINIGALVYGMWIGVMATSALVLAVGVGGAFWLTALGGLFFVSSDFLIGITDIRGVQIKNANDWVWLTYLAGQMGIIYAGWLR